MKKIAIIVEPSRAYGRAVIRGIADFAREKRDWSLQLLSDKTASSETLRNFDGAIARIANETLAKRLRRTGLSVVDVFCDRRRPGFGMVGSDHAAIGTKAADFFRSRGFANFAFLGIPGTTFSEDRSAAFAKACPTKPFIYANDREHSLWDEMIFRENPERFADKARVRKWLKSLPKPVAIFCCSDIRALQLQQVALACKFNVPQDVAILGVDDDTMICSLATVPISSIDPNAKSIGYTAARVLNAIMDDSPQQKVHRVYRVPCGQLVERTSTEHFPMDPPWLGSVLLHIEQNLGKALSAREIFTLSGHGAALVERVFNEKLGTSVQVHINNRKLAEAKRLLADPSLRISEIAYACGYKTPQYFCKIFTDAYGQSPKAYRVHAKQPTTS